MGMKNKNDHQNDGHYLPQLKTGIAYEMIIELFERGGQVALS